jgi:hypothetical protein
MPVTAVSVPNYTDYSYQNNKKQIKQEFQQLGQDLGLGNLAAAQADFATLQKDLPQAGATSAAQGAAASTTQGTSTIAADFSQLSKDLQSGNLSAAQTDYSTIKQDFKSRASQSDDAAQGSQAVEGHHHHHHGGGSSSAEITQLMNELGQSLQSGDVSAAQKAFSALQTDFQQFAAGGGKVSQTASATGSNSISVNA